MKTKIFAFIIASVMAFTMLSITCLDVLASSYPVITSLEAPQNLRVENQTDEDGTPYLNLIWANPQSIQDLFAAADAVGEAPLAYQIDVKAGNSKWTYEILGDIINGNGLYIDENDIVS